MYSAHSGIYDMDFVDLEVLDVQLLFMDDTPRYYPDNADLVKVTVNVTNNGYDFFLVHDKMFHIWAMETDISRSTPDNEVLEVVDNYETTYDVQLEVNYENFQSRELYEECDYLNAVIQQDNSKSFTLCFEVLRIWKNEALSFEGDKKYYLLMMDNVQATSCPDCKKILLTYAKPTLAEFKMPPWVENLFSWHTLGLISQEDFENSLNYLQEIGLVTQAIPSKIKSDEMTIDEKNQQLEEHQIRVAAAQATNLYVSASIFYESEHSDDFNGVLCRQQNNIVTLSGDYFNDDAYYDAVFFKLSLYDDSGNVAETGLSKIIDVVPKELRHFDVSSPYSGKINRCLIMIDSKFN
jgi:hypothetical protein